MMKKYFCIVGIKAPTIIILFLCNLKHLYQTIVKNIVENKYKNAHAKPLSLFTRKRNMALNPSVGMWPKLTPLK